MKLLIITTDRFPHGNAGATRQEVLSKIFVHLGWDVDVVGLGTYTGPSFINLEPHINYLSLRGQKQTFISRLRDRILYTNRLKKVVTLQAYNSVLVESIPFSALRYVKSYKGKVGLIHDSVEWYSSSEFRLGMFDPEYIIKDLQNRRWINKDFKVIAISRFLYAHFKKKGCITTRIPFIYDVIGCGSKLKINTEKIVFLYAGMIGNKDHMVNFLKAIDRLDDYEKQRIKVELYGFTKEYIKRMQKIDSNLLDRLENIVSFYGRVERSVVESALERASFTILFRNANERYAKAGFPTKVVESLSHSTPVLCNLSSDLELYLSDGYNAVVCGSESVDDIHSALKRILSMNKSTINNLQNQAYCSALHFFDYRVYANCVKSLMGDN